MDYSPYLKLIQAYEKVNSLIIKSLISEHATSRKQMIDDYNHYQAKELPILSRTFTDTEKTNRKLINDFRGEIVDQAVGFLFGKPITYGLNKEKYKGDENAYARDLENFREFLANNQIEDVDLETGKKQGICGACPRLLYIDKAGKERVMYLNPWEVIVIYDSSIDKVQYAMRYYDIDIIDVEGNKKTRTKVEWYDTEKVTYFLQGEDGGYALDTTETENPKVHLFKEVPIIEILNNDERLSDFYKVESLIDAYDRALSDAQNETEEFRLAYMVLEGVDITKEILAEARVTGAISYDIGGKAGYLTKDINDTFLENHKKNLRDNIYRFAKRIDMQSETFTGQGSSGEARKWIMTALEFSVAIKQLKFAKGIINMFKVLQTAWSVKEIGITYDKVTFSFDRNFPQELKLEAEILGSLKGLVSLKTALGLFSPVRDVDEEIKRIEQEKQDQVDLDAEQMATDEEKAAAAAEAARIAAGGAQ